MIVAPMCTNSESEGILFAITEDRAGIQFFDLIVADGEDAPRTLEFGTSHFGNRDKSTVNSGAKLFLLISKLDSSEHR
jgi:hypothetical protein